MHPLKLSYFNNIENQLFTISHLLVTTEDDNNH